MAVYVHWDDEDKSILCQVYTGAWTLDEFNHTIRKTHKLLSGLPHTVHIIVDLTQSERSPSNILAAIRDLDRYTTPNQGLVVLVGADAFSRSIISMAKRLAPRATLNGHFADSITEARQYIAMNAPDMLLAR